MASAWLLLSLSLLVTLLSQSCDAVPSRRRTVKQCPRGFKAVFIEGKQDCICADYHVYWPKTGECYPQYTQGPCKQGQHLVSNATGHSECICPGLWARWTDGHCYQEYARGPCPEGQLFMKDSAGKGFCSCDKRLTMFYYPETESCHPLYEQGPCNDGHILKFDYGAGRPRCVCRDGHMLEENGKCYPLNTAGPCDQALCNDGINCYLRNLDTLKTECKCLTGNVTTTDGHCFEPYSRGPCPLGHWLVFSEPGVAVCQKKEQCARYDNWFFWNEDQRCYRQYSKGPCPDGRLFYLDIQTGEAGCHCRPDWTPYFYEKDGQCYEQHSVGPCKVGKYFSFNKTSQRTECNCFTSHVLETSTDTCYEKLTQGPCDVGELVVKSSFDETLQCSCTPTMKGNYWPSTKKCYQHFQQGPCPVGHSFRPSPHTGRPTCMVWG